MMGIGRGRRRREREMLGTAEGAATSSPAEGGEITRRKIRISS